MKVCLTQHRYREMGLRIQAMELELLGDNSLYEKTELQKDKEMEEVWPSQSGGPSLNLQESHRFCDSA